MKFKKDRLGTVFIITGILLLLCCIGLFVWNQILADRAREDMDEQLDIVAAEIQKRQDPEKSTENRTTESRTGKEIPVTEQGHKSMPVVEKDGNDYIGYLSIPSVDLQIPVMNTYDDRKLEKAACRYYGSLETEDMVLAGHNYRNTLGKLKSISLGDTVEFVNMNGEVYRYTVGELEVLKPEAVHEMVESKWELSIYTCTYLGSERFTVRCKSE